jgi:hypothetical protein
MDAQWQLRATLTIDLDHEQLQILEGQRGARAKVLFRGVWLSEGIDPRRLVPGRDARVAPGSEDRPVFDWLAGARVALPVQPKGEIS